LIRFQWASLQIRQLLSLERESDIRDRLGKVPKDLTATYNEIYTAINTQDGSKPDVANKAFQWLISSVEPLQADALVAAVCQDTHTDEPQLVDIDIGFVVDACRNLVVVDQLSICRFSHLSVQEYFEEQHPWITDQANGLIAKVYLLLLNYTGNCEADHSDDETGQPKPLKMLLDYARALWPDHLQRIGPSTMDDRLAAGLQKFLGSTNESSIAYRHWYTTYGRHESEYHPLSGTHLLSQYSRLNPPDSALLPTCLFGFEPVMTKLCQMEELNANQRNKEGYPLLSLAVMGGNMKVVQLLLENGADVNAQADENYESALSLAVYRGNEAIVQLLLKNGADVNAQVGTSNTSILTKAIMEDNEVIIRLLLKNGADINAQIGGDFGSAFAIAANKGNQGIVQLLLENGADINAQAGSFGSALVIAAKNGHEAIVRLLLENGADFNTQVDGDFGSVLVAAGIGGNEAIVQLLLENGADINAQPGGRYGSALAAAVLSGRELIVQLFLKNGADVNAQLGGEYGSALAAAGTGGHEAIVQLLLENGADVNALLGGDYGSALAAAAVSGNEAIIRMLFKNGADINAQLSGEYGSALAAAVYKGNEAIVQLFLENGANINALLGGDYGSVLAAAGYGGNEAIVRLLLKNSADVNAQLSGRYGSALAAAVYKGNKAIAQLLLENGADVNAQLSGRYGSALTAAATKLGGLDGFFLAFEGDVYKTKEPIMRLLLENGADVNQRGGRHGSVLNTLAFEGRTDILRLCYEQYYGNRQLIDDQGRTPLHLAARGGHKPTFDYLIGLGLDTSAKDAKGDNILHYAASGGSLEILDGILDKYHIDLSHSLYWSPLHLACRTGGFEVIKRLVGKGASGGYVVTTQPDQKWTPYSVAVFHQNHSITSASTLLGLDKSLHNESVIMPGERHRGVSCHGCFHVSLMP
jgi:ankyrin repeat protein